MILIIVTVQYKLLGKLESYSMLIVSQFNLPTPFEGVIFLGFLAGLIFVWMEIQNFWNRVIQEDNKPYSLFSKIALMITVIGVVCLLYLSYFYLSPLLSTYKVWIIAVVSLLYAPIIFVVIFIGIRFFSDCYPIECENIKETIKDVANKAKIKVPRIYFVKGEFFKNNAMAFKIGKNIDIYLHKELKHNLLAEELVAVALHEYGHVKYRHMLYRSLMMSLTI